MPGSAVVPVGNGALLIGMSSWLRLAAPGVRVIGVQAAGADAMTRRGLPVTRSIPPTADTFADGIASRISIPAAVELLPGRVDAMVTVPEEAIQVAQAELTDELGITVEGAAAVGWAALLADPDRSGPVLLVVTGSNT